MKYGYDYMNHGISFIAKKQYLKLLPKLKSELKPSSYCEKILAWDELDNNIKIKDFGELTTYIQFFAIFCNFTKSFKDRYDVHLWHIKLIRRMGFNYEDYISLDIKRPYGNSNVWGDVNEVALKSLTDEECKELHLETLRIFDKALKELNLISLEFERIGGQRWHPTKRGIAEMKQYIREKKLKRLKKLSNGI